MVGEEKLMPIIRKEKGNKTTSRHESGGFQLFYILKIADTDDIMKLMILYQKENIYDF